MAKKSNDKYAPQNKAQADALTKALTAANGFAAEDGFAEKVEAGLRNAKKKKTKK